MTKIKLNLFDGIFFCTLLPNSGILLTTLVFIAALFAPQDSSVYKGLVFTYLICFLILGISVIICFIINVKSKNVLILETESFSIHGKTYLYSEIVWGAYHVCKWYAIPLAYFLKQQAGGLVELKLNHGDWIYIKVFYSDYLKIKKKVENVVTIREK